MENRKIVIIHRDPAFASNVISLKDKLSEFGFADVAVCSPDGDMRPPDDADSEVKVRNWVNSQVKASGFNGFFYVFKDNTTVNTDPRLFMSDLEHMMRAVDYSAWMSTVTDRCNYIFSKYNPRIRISMDRPDVVEKTGVSCSVVFTSHSNSQLIVYDFSKVPDDLLRFDDSFTVDMFWIIEFLARRRALDSATFKMNQYMSVESEYGVLGVVSSSDACKSGNDVMSAENEKFKSKGLNVAPDNNIDDVLTCFWEKLKHNAGIEK